MGVNFLYYPIEFALTLSFQAFTKEFILSWEVTNKVIFAICIDPSSTKKKTKFLLANIVILFNLFSLVCVGEIHISMSKYIHAVVKATS